MVIHLLSGPIRTGKTTRLRRWAAARPEVQGLLMPTDAHGRRYFLDLRSGLQWPVSARPGQWPVVSIGRFQFSPAAFAWADAALRGAAEKAPAWLIIDEIGPLELRGAGLAPALETVLRAENPPAHLILVVRTALVGKVMQHFRLTRWRIVSFWEKH